MYWDRHRPQSRYHCHVSRILTLIEEVKLISFSQQQASSSYPCRKNARCYCRRQYRSPGISVWRPGADQVLAACHGAIGCDIEDALATKDKCGEGRYTATTTTTIIEPAAAIKFGIFYVIHAGLWCY